MSYAQAAQWIQEAAPISVLTGAGVSAQSGIPTFRGEGGLWKNYPPELFGSRMGIAFTFLLFPSWFRRFLIESMDTFARAEPNPTHAILAGWEARGWVEGIITQNVDQLHQEAGSQRVIEVHGNYFRSRCKSCGHSELLSKGLLSDFTAALKDDPPGRIALYKRLQRDFFRCPRCKGRRGPDMVLFGDALSPQIWEQARALSAACRAMLVIGTSASVYPVAELPFVAREQGVKLIEINPEPSALTPFVDLFLPASSVEAMEALDALLHGEA